MECEAHGCNGAVVWYVLRAISSVEGYGVLKETPIR